MTMPADQADNFGRVNSPFAQKPYLSIVGWARNDGYIENYLERINHAIGFLARQLDQQQLNSEIILVEWNPPVSRPFLQEVIAPLVSTTHVTFRIIRVGEQFHRDKDGWRDRGMHVSAALNVGLRRGRGQFLLPKALDTYFSPALVQALAARDLRDDAVYRCDRLDAKLDSNSWMQLPDNEAVEILSANVVHRNSRLQQSVDWKIRDLHTNACGDFTLLSSDRWHAIRGYAKDPTVLCLDADSIALHAAVAHGAEEVHWMSGRNVFKVVHGHTHTSRTRTVWKGWQQKLDRYLVENKKRELAAKLRILFNYPRRRVVGVESILAPSIERNFVAKAERFARNDTSLTTNDKNWGLAGVTLPEKVVTRAAWDKP